MLWNSSYKLIELIEIVGLDGRYQNQAVIRKRSVNISNSLSLAKCMHRLALFYGSETLFSRIG